MYLGAFIIKNSTNSQHESNARHDINNNYVNVDQTSHNYNQLDYQPKHEIAIFIDDKPYNTNSNENKKLNFFNALLDSIKYSFIDVIIVFEAFANYINEIILMVNMKLFKLELTNVLIKAKYIYRLIAFICYICTFYRLFSNILVIFNTLSGIVAQDNRYLNLIRS